MKDVAKSHMFRRGETWYYRRRVPADVVAAVGRKFIQRSLQTQDKKVAADRCEIADVEASALFDAHRNASVPLKPVSTLSQSEYLERVRSYVQRKDAGFQKWRREAVLGPETLRGIVQDQEWQLQILADDTDPRADEWVSSAVNDILAEAKLDASGLVGEAYAEVAETVRRSLVELTRRKHVALRGEFDRAFYDILFDRDRPAPVSFGELAEQFLAIEVEDGNANGVSAKTLAKTKAQVTVIRELVGDATLVSIINYDRCLEVRRLVASLPRNKEKFYPTLSLSKAIQRAKEDGKALLSATSQGEYVSRFRAILELGTHKGLLRHNPASNLRPLRRTAGKKRQSFTLDQIRDFFTSDFYQSCAPATEKPYVKHDRHWRFWLPLLALFTGMRPNEICQMLTSDVRQTNQGTWFFDIVTSSDDDEDTVEKTLKTEPSRRRIPMHPELIALGFLDLVEKQKTSGAERLLPGIKPNTYSNLAAYPLKRFRDRFLPDAISVEAGQTFYSFRHSFRDGLRRFNASPDTLKALGGWSQGSLVSDGYGTKDDPDLQAKEIAKLSYPGLDLNFLRLPTTGGIDASHK